VNVAPQWGFQRGFETYRYLAEDENSPTVHVGSDVLNAHALEWLTADRQRPFFLYLHATDPHSPYRPPPPWAERLADGVALAPEQLDAVLLNFRQHDIGPTADEVRALTAAYDGEVAFTDENLGHLLSELRRLGLYDRTLILVIADHGEEFADHGGLEHGRTLYEEMLHVPLIVRAPGAPAGIRVAGKVQQIDVLPTVLDYLSIPGPADLPGRSLLPGIAGAQLDPVDAFAETALGRRQVLDAIIAGDWKVIRRRTTSAETVEAYDLGADPGERGDRGLQRPVLLGYARQALAAWAGAAATETTPAIESPPDPALMERLRALGYAD
jgi:arylsulfatase A-like enzyme